MPHPKVKLSDNSGNEVSVTGNRLDVNAVLSASDDINIGNVVLQNDSGVDVAVRQANSDSDPDLDSSQLLATHALLSARSDISTTIGLTALDSTHNALHVAITDGAGIANINGSNQLEVEVKNTSLAVTNDGTFAVQAGHDITGMITSANTAVSDSTAEVISGIGASCKRIDMMASPSNTGDIWVGGSDVDVNKGIKLSPGDFYSIDIDSTGDVYVISTEDGEDINYTYFT